MSQPDGEAQKRVYERLAAVHRDLDRAVAESTAEETAVEELVELARTLAKGGPYAATVERFARDHGYGRTQRQDPPPVVIHTEDPRDRWPHY